MSNVGSGTTYKRDVHDTTEWDDIQRKLGNLAPLPDKPKTVAEVMAEADEPPAAHPLEGKTADEVDSDEDLDEFLDSHELEKWKAARIAEMKSKAAKDRFGEVLPLTRPEFITEVNDASKDGTWVVVLLYQDGVVDSKLIERCLPAVAARCRSTKFMKIVATQCIENYPDRNVPTLLLYHKGELESRMVGIGKMGGKEVTPLILEWALKLFGAVESDLEEDPRKDTTERSAPRGVYERF